MQYDRDRNHVCRVLRVSALRFVSGPEPHYLEGAAERTSSGLEIPGLWISWSELGGSRLSGGGSSTGLSFSSDSSSALLMRMSAKPLRPFQLGVVQDAGRKVGELGTELVAFLVRGLLCLAIHSQLALQVAYHLIGGIHFEDAFCADDS